MYLEHFGLKRQPFKITPDTSLFYKGNKRGAALQALKYAIESGEGIIKVVGEVGSGKTMLCRMLEQELARHIEIVYIANPSLSPENILHVVAFELKLDIKDRSSKLEVMQKLQAYLLEKHAENKQVLVLVEEAQSMPVETLEEIRLLSNLETSDHKLLQMVLFGQPELDDKLQLKEIRQLKERITHSFYLDPFFSTDIYDYLNYRMHAVGYRGPEIFSSKVAQSISKESMGLTRRINILADKALLAVYAEGDHDISKKHIKIAVQDSEFSKFESYHKQLKWAVVVMVLMAISLWGGMQIGLQGNINKISPEHRMLENSSVVNIQNKINKLPVKEEVLEKKDWPENIDDSRITIQLMLLDDWGLRQFNKKINLAQLKEQIHIYNMRVNNKKLNSVIYGDYKNKKKAAEVLASLPDYLKEKGAYLRSYKGIKADIQKSMVQQVQPGEIN